MQDTRQICAVRLETSALGRRLGSSMLMILAALGCSDGSRSTRPDESTPSSKPFIAAVNAQESPDPIVYISLPPGAIVGGKRAILNVQRTGSSTQTTLIDGGFDPVSVRAMPGDVVTIIVDLGIERGAINYEIVVPKPSRPIVVRTKPVKQKRDVPLNASMKVVFSEPIDAATLTDAAIQLTRAGLPVKGHLEFADAEHLTAVFTPEVALEAGADYVLMITEAIHDLDGSALDGAVTVPFTTADPIPPGGPIPPSLVFTVQPTTTHVNSYITPNVQVSVVDSTGRVMSEYRGDFPRIRLTNAGNAKLDGVGNISVDAGVVTFPILMVDAVGAGYTLVVEGDGVTSATSMPFTVTDLPPVGALAISVTTSGTGGPDGYFISVNNGAPVGIGVNASINVPNLGKGRYHVALTGFGSNCMVTGESFATVEVVPYQTTDVHFSVTCGIAGSIRVTTTTSGTDPDPDGYVLRLRVAGMNTVAPLPASGTTVATVARTGPSVITLAGVAENCRVAGGAARQVDVGAAETALITFDVSCEAVTQLAFVRDGQIYLVNSNGTGLTQLTKEPGLFSYDPAWSPDGKRIAFTRGKGTDDVWEIFVMDATGANVVKRTSRGGYNYDATWSPDGRKIAFTAVDSSADVYVMSAEDDGSPARRITNRPGYDAEPTWSSDGRRIFFISDWRAYDFVRDLYVVDAADGANVAMVAAGPFFWPNVVLLFQPESSPDGRIAVVECSTGYYDCETSTVAILRADGSNRVAVSTGRFFSGPTWSPGGGTLAFTASGCPGCARSIRYVRADGSYEDTIIENGSNAAWRPRP